MSRFRHWLTSHRTPPEPVQVFRMNPTWRYFAPTYVVPLRFDLPVGLPNILTVHDARVAVGSDDRSVATNATISNDPLAGDTDVSLWYSQADAPDCTCDILEIAYTTGLGVPQHLRPFQPEGLSSAISDDLLLILKQVTNDYIRQQRQEIIASHDYVSNIKHRSVVAIDRLPFEFDESSASLDQLRFQVSVQQHRVEKWKTDEPKNFFWQLAKASTQNIAVPIQQPQQTDVSNFRFSTIESFPNELWTDVDVSINLLTPIGKSAANGKSYRQTESIWEQKGFIDDDEQPSDSTGGRKAYRQRKDRLGDTRQTQSIWDLIFPLLKPPIDFASGRSLFWPSTLYPFQIEGVQKLASNPAFLLADEMGTGKTVMTCVALSILYHKGAIRRTLILCPKSVLAVWDQHLLDWASELSVTVVNGSSSRDIRDIDWKCPAHVYVATYDTFRNDHKRSEIDRFDAVVIDEAHWIKNAESGRARASRQMTQFASFRWALTGTPIQNSVDDLCSIFRCLKPDLFRQDEELNAETARNRIRPYFLRRRKQDVFKDLPKKILTDEWLEMDEDQAKAYNKLLEAGKDEFRTGKKEFTKMHVFALLRKLTQICNFAPGESRSPKTDALSDQVEQIVANGKKVLVYSQYIEEGVAKLEAILRQHGLVKITGSTSQEKRKAAVDRFQSDADVRVFLGSVRAAGEGITLTAASYVIHFDHWWNPAVMWQAEDRAHRKGQTETVNVYSYWMRDTIEERIKQKLEQKSLLHKDIIDRLSEEEFDEALTIDDLLDIFELDRGAVKMPTPSVHARPATDSGKLVEALQQLSKMDPMDFELLAREVMKKAFGYVNARVTKRSHDGGIDIVGSKTTRTGIERIIAQCKRKPLVGPEVGRELLGVLTSNSSLSKAYLIVSGSVTDACRQFCLASGRIDIIDGPHLARIIIDQGIAVKGVD